MDPPHGAVGWFMCVTVVFPDQTHLLFYNHLAEGNDYTRSVALPQGVVAGLRCVIVVFPGHTYLLIISSVSLMHVLSGLIVAQLVICQW